MKDLLVEVLLDYAPLMKDKNLSIKTMLKLIDYKLCLTDHSNIRDLYINSFEDLNKLLSTSLQLVDEDCKKLLSDGAINYLRQNTKSVNDEDTLSMYKSKRLSMYNRYDSDIVEIYNKLFKDKSDEGTK